jgi:PAS domain S-box-containing protein
MRKHIFEIAALVAVSAVLASCAGTFRALDDLPQIQRQLVSLEERQEKLSGIRSTLGLTRWHARVVALGGGEAVLNELTSTLARGKQLVTEVLNDNPPANVRSLVLECDDLFSQISEMQAKTDSLSDEERINFQDRGDSLNSQLQQQIATDRRQLQQMRQSAVGQRSQAAYRLFGGHGLMLAVIGFLYFARRTEKRRRELTDLKLLESDERFALIVRGSADGIILTDAVGKIQMSNPGLDQMFGAGEHDLEGKLVSSLFDTTAIDEWLTHRLSEDHEGVLSRTVIAKRTDGNRFNAELTITPRTIHHQDFLAISVRDVSEREVSRLRLKQHEALLREIPEPLHILDSVGHVIYWNLGAQRLFGYTATEAIGQSANDLLRIIPPARDSDNIHATEYAEADRWIGELDAVTKDGRRLRIERRRTRIAEGDDTIGEVIFDLDLGERTRLQRVQRRRQRLEALGTLASGIAHDLNNLLTPILMSSRMLQRGGENLNREALLETIVTGASRGAELISQLLTFARGGDGQHRPVDVGELLAEVSGILAHTLKKEISLQVSIAPDLPEIMGDETEISQVIMNLAINARDAMPDGGKLAISANPMSLDKERTFSLVTLQPGDYLAISVRDTGTGIPASIRDRIFDPFFTTKDRGQGTGLGLSTSLGIVRSHDGAVDVTSSVGGGTTVKVIFPLSPIKTETHPMLDVASPG